MTLFRQVTVCQNVAMIFVKHPFCFVFGLVLGLFSGCAWFTGSEDANLPRFPKSRRFFSSFGEVVEITNGSMEHLTALLEGHDFSFILFYAPWSGKSWKVAQQFKRAAKILRSEVSFIAINCWIGSCSQQNKVDLFPKLVVIHTVFDGIEYKGTYRASKMVGFIHSVMRPFVHIGTHAELAILKKSNQEIVIGYFNQTALNSRNYSTFFNLTLQFISEVSKPTFAVVTNTELAFQTGVKHVSGVAYHRINQPVLIYPALKRFTVVALLTWIEANRYQLITQLKPTFAGKDHITRHLSKGPALILFLPIKQHMAPESLQLSHTYLQVASQYFNCSCNRTSAVTTSSAAAVSNVSTKDTKEPSRQVELEDVLSNTSHLTRLFDNEVDIIMGAKETVLPSFLGKRENVETCRSVRVQRQHERKGNKLNICHVCHICKLESCIKERRFEVLNMEALALTNSCSSVKPRYYSRGTTSICCTVRSADGINHLSPLDRIQTVSLRSLRELEKGWDDFFTDILDSITKSFGSEMRKNVQDNAKEAKPSSEQNVRYNSPGRAQKDSSEGGASSSSPLPLLRDTYTTLNEAPRVGVANNACVRTGHVTEFLGAGCHSNRSVNFFIMDSTECWTVAEKLGVRRSDKAKVALLIADLKNEAQFVLDESVSITNSSVVDFVMGYMAGNLTRRFRSGRPAPRQCPSAYACVIEVVTSTFEDIVLDETKDVLLMYYAPWCGFCQALGPVLLTVAKYFQDVPDVTIARINADENDLPWVLHVERLPSFILFPAHRKDFSVPFTDALERTAANLIQFVFEHRGKTTEITEEHCRSKVAEKKIHELRVTLRQMEEEKRRMEVVLGEAVRAKDLWKHKQAIAVKGLKQVEQELANQREMRLAAKVYTRSVEKKQKETEEKVLRLVAGNARVLGDLQATEGKLKQKEKQLSLLAKENRRISLEKDELLGQQRKKESILEGERKTVLELYNLVTALRRRVTRLHFSNNALRLKLRNHSEYLHIRNMLSTSKAEIQNSGTLHEGADENEDPIESSTEHDFSSVQNKSKDTVSPDNVIN